MKHNFINIYDNLRSVVNFKFLIYFSLINFALIAHSRIIAIALSSNSAGTFIKREKNEKNLNYKKKEFCNLSSGRCIVRHVTIFVIRITPHMSFNFTIYSTDNFFIMKNLVRHALFFTWLIFIIL